MPDTADTIETLFRTFQRAFRAGDYTAAEQLIHERIAVIGTHADSPDLARAYTNLGLVYFFRNELGTAERHFTAALEMDRRLNHPLGIARSLGNLSLVPEARGDYDRAETLLLESLAIARRIGNDELAAGKLANLGDIALARGRTEHARAYFLDAMALFERVGIEVHVAALREKLRHFDSPPSTRVRPLA